MGRYFLRGGKVFLWWWEGCFLCGCCWTENATFIATSSGQLFVVVLVVGAGGIFL